MKTLVNTIVSAERDPLGAAGCDALIHRRPGVPERRLCSRPHRFVSLGLFGHVHLCGIHARVIDWAPNEKHARLYRPGCPLCTALSPLDAERAMILAEIARLQRSYPPEHVDDAAAAARGALEDVAEFVRGRRGG